MPDELTHNKQTLGREYDKWNMLLNYDYRNIVIKKRGIEHKAEREGWTIVPRL